MTTRYHFSAVFIALGLATACGTSSETIPPGGDAGADADASGDADIDARADADTDGGMTYACPPGPMSPLGEPCDEEGAVCAYGYDPPECGGITVICVDGRFEEREHTDPSSECVPPEVVPCGDVHAAYKTHVDDNRACAFDDECAVIGGTGTCDCAPAIYHGSGDALHADAVADAQRLAERYWDCVDSGEIEIVAGVCDAAPGTPSCVSGVCQTTAGSCFGEPDTGDDGGVPDAG